MDIFSDIDLGLGFSTFGWGEEPKRELKNPPDFDSNSNSSSIWGWILAAVSDADTDGVRAAVPMKSGCDKLI